MKSKFVLTVYADIEIEDDVIKRLNRIVNEHGGEIIKTNYSVVSGKLVGVLLVDINMDFANVFYAHLDGLNEHNIFVEVMPYVEHVEESSTRAYVDFSALDKPDVMRELALSLKKNNIRVSGFKAKRVNGAEASETKLEANFMADLPSDVALFDLEQLLESNKGITRVSVN